MIELELAEKQRTVLETLGTAHGYRSAADVLRYLVASVSDGVRRPGAWERQVVLMLFGDEAVQAAQFEIARAELPEDSFEVDHDTEPPPGTQSGRCTGCGDPLLLRGGIWHHAYVECEAWKADQSKCVYTEPT